MRIVLICTVFGENRSHRVKLSFLKFSRILVAKNHTKSSQKWNIRSKIFTGKSFGRQNMKHRESSETRFPQVWGRSEPSSGGKRPFQIFAFERRTSRFERRTSRLNADRRVWTPNVAFERRKSIFERRTLTFERVDPEIRGARNSATSLNISRQIVCWHLLTFAPSV